MSEGKGDTADLFTKKERQIASHSFLIAIHYYLSCLCFLHIVIHLWYTHEYFPLPGERKFTVHFRLDTRSSSGDINEFRPPPFPGTISCKVQIAFDCDEMFPPFSLSGTSKHPHPALFSPLLHPHLPRLRMSRNISCLGTQLNLCDWWQDCFFGNCKYSRCKKCKVCFSDPKRER